MKNKNVFTSKKFGAFFTSLCALSLNSWYVLNTVELSVTQASVVSLIAFGIVALCLGFVLPQAKFDKSMAVILAAVDKQAPEPLLGQWQSTKPEGGKK